jgi:hypothetical protein
MSTRTERMSRLLALQQQMHRVERWKLLALQRRSSELETERLELIAALNGTDALHGLFLDAAARRLTSLAKQAGLLAREEEAQTARVGEFAVRVACAERLSEEAEAEAARENEKQALGDVVDRLMAGAAPASRKIATS